jgi:hypothetical protein
MIVKCMEKHDGDKLPRHDEFYDLITQQHVVKPSDIPFSDGAILIGTGNGISA